MTEDGVFEPHPDATPITGIVCMADWNEQKQCWIGVICQALKNPDGTEGVVLYDVGSAETKVEIDDWGRNSIARATGDA